MQQHGLCSHLLTFKAPLPAQLVCKAASYSNEIIGYMALQTQADLVMRAPAVQLGGAFHPVARRRALTRTQPAFMHELITGNAGLPTSRDVACQWKAAFW
jgi:hypothetical protein